MAIRNFWSLKVDEALVATYLKDELKKKGYQVFFPLNSELPDVDLLLYNLKNKRCNYTIQVKGTRTYEPNPREIERFGDGQAGWIKINHNKIFKPHFPVDYFVFVIHLEFNGPTRREIKPCYLFIPTAKLQEICRKKRPQRNNSYRFFIWVNPQTQRVSEFGDGRQNVFNLTYYYKIPDKF